MYDLLSHLIQENVGMRSAIQAPFFEKNLKIFVSSSSVCRKYVQSISWNKKLKLKIIT